MTAAFVALLSLGASPLLAEIRISQVYQWGGADAGGFGQDYVELYNAGNSDVSFSGFLGFYGSSADWLGGAQVSGSIPAKGFFLVAVGDAGTGRSLPAVDGSIENSDLPQSQSFTAIIWELVESDYRVLDYVGIGEAPYFYEGGAPAPAAGSPLLSTRRSDLSVDSNDNAADFSIGLASPRNTLFGLPAISSIAAQRINEDESTASLAFQVGSAGRDPSALLVTALSSNATLVPNDASSLVLGGTAGNRTITVKPVAGASGKTVITITASDGQYSAQTSFQLTVNGRPDIAELPDISVPVETALQPINFGVADAEMLGETVLRVMAANTTSGNNQAYEDPGDRIFQGLKPDVAVIQEFNVSPSRYPSIRAWVDANFGSDFYFYREPISGIPNGIVSRWPILKAGYWDDAEMTNREFAWARIDVPGEKELWAISVHFNAGSSDAASRARQGTALASYIASIVPANDYLLVGGDLNTFSRTESAVINLATGLVTQGPWPTDQLGDSDTNAGRTSPYDWVLAESELDLLETPLDVGSLSFENGLVFDSRIFEPLSAVAPVQRQDSAAPNMQHMAVLREFTLPAPFELAVTASSSNQSLLRNEGIMVSGAGPKRTLLLTPQPNVTGATTITLTVSDGEVSASEQFVLRVEAKTFSSWITTTKVPADRRGSSDRNGPSGLANLLAYAMAIDPMDVVPADLARVTESATPASDLISFVYRRAKSHPGVSLSVEGSADLSNWSPAQIASEQTTSLSEMREEVLVHVQQPAGTRYFLRLKAESN